MATINMTCINCPIGCSLTVTVSGGEVTEVKGNLCARGLAYAKMEVTNPTRMMTSTVRLRGGAIRQVPVKTRSPVPKNMVVDCVKALAEVELTAPVVLGQVVLADACGTGVDIIATRSVSKNG